MMDVLRKFKRERGSDTAIVSMRLIVTAGTVVLIAAAVIGAGSVAERNVRRVLTRELETRLVLEARNLALISASALLSEFPELTLHPILKKMHQERPDLSALYVIDNNRIIQGHPEVTMLRDPFEPDTTLVPVKSDILLESEETMLGNSNLLVVSTPVIHSSGKRIGTAIVGLERTYIEALVTKARRNQGVLLFAILAVSMLLTPVLISFLLRPLKVLRHGLERIGAGDLDARVELSSMTELGVLSRSVNDMAARLKSAQQDLIEKERLDHEMDLAREIQQSLLPPRKTEINGFVIAGSQRAAETVGGDYYDVFQLGDGKTGLVIADVAGKGLGGCLVTSMIAVLIRTLCPSHASPSALLAALHEALAGFLQPGVFVTMFYGILDSKTGRLVYASAGHNPVLHYTADRSEIEWLKTKGIPLGLIPGEMLRASLIDYTIDMEPGDLVLQYTDGFHEAVNEDEEEFGFDRMVGLVKQFVSQGTEAVITSLQDAVAAWEMPRTASDDQTLLLISRSEQFVNTHAINEFAGSELTSRPELAARLWEKRSDRHHFTMPATFAALDEIRTWLKGCSVFNDLLQEDFERMEQGLYEVGANIAEHGCGLDASKAIDIWWIPEETGGSGPVMEESRNGVSARGHVDSGYFLIRDHGKPSRADQWPLHDVTSETVRRAGRGLGLHIIFRVFDEIEFHAGMDIGNLTIMRFRHSQPQHT